MFRKLFIAIICAIIAILAIDTCAKDTLMIEINVLGLNDETTANSKAQLLITQKRMGDPLTEAKIVQLYTKAPEIILESIKPYGYFKANVHSSIQHLKNNWTLTFSVTPGPALKLSAVTINVSGEGADNKKVRKYLQDVSLKVGQSLNIATYQKVKDDLFQLLNDEGYLKATLEKKAILIDLKKYTAVIILQMQTGARYYFGDIIFQQNAFSNDFLTRFIPFKKDEPFSSQKLLKLQQDLLASHYFKQVMVNPDFDQTTHYQIPTHITLTPPKSQLYNVGVGYGTFTGPRLTLGMNFRHLTDTGQQFNAQLKLSPVLSGLTAKYLIAGSNPLTDQYTLGANIQEFKPKNGQSFSQTLSASYSKNLTEWEYTTSLSYLHELFRVRQSPDSRSTLLYPTLNISKISADNIVNPTRGHSINFTAQGANSAILSTTSFAQGELKGKAIFSPTPLSRLILRGDIGYTVVKNLDQLPLTLRFFAGGIDSVRGFAYSSLGPGRYLETVSLEAQHAIIGNWYGAVFYDMGNATNHFNDCFNRGAGVGILYQSIVGPIKVYLARAESKPDKPFSIEFSIGPDF